MKPACVYKHSHLIFVKKKSMAEMYVYVSIFIFMYISVPQSVPSSLLPTQRRESH